MAVAQVVRASGCGPEGRRFESDQPPHFFARIPEVLDGVSPIFFALKVELSAKNRQFASLRCFKAADFRLEPRTSCAFGWLPSLSLRLALRRVARKAFGLLRRNEMKPDEVAACGGRMFFFLQRTSCAFGWLPCASRPAVCDAHAHFGLTPSCVAQKAVGLPRRSKAKTGEVAACGGRMCFFLQRT